MDREKVIKGLQAHADGCGYRSHHCDVMECPYRYGDESCDIEEMCRDALALLKEQEVKTGYWIESAGNDKCSICGEEYSDLYPDYGNTHFCPNCGAKMEGR